MGRSVWVACCWVAIASVHAMGDVRDLATAEERGGVASFLTNSESYTPLSRAMADPTGAVDWHWVWFMMVLSSVIIAGFARIFWFWRRAYLAEASRERRGLLRDLSRVFFWCMLSGQVLLMVVLVWPAYRLLVLGMIPLALATCSLSARLEGVRVTFRVTRKDRGMLEESLLERTAELEAEIEARTAELREARDAANAANEAKSAFIAAVSHEIRTPLNAIMGYSELLADGVRDEPTRSAYAGVVRRNGDHLATVIDDVLDIAKIESQRLSIEAVPCSPGLIMNDVVSLLRPKAEAKGIVIACGVEKTIPSIVLSDPTRIRQVLINLAGNAVKFTEEGSVRIVLAASGEGRDCRLRFEVIDTGIGLTQDQSVQIFEPFRQAEPGTTRRYGGTGLGLTISRSLTGLMGGTISVVSTPGTGSVFTATMTTTVPSGTPWVGDLAELSRIEQAETRDVPIRGRVLIADDSIDNRRLLNAFLDAIGLDCLEAEDGIEAVKAVEAAHTAGEPFDLVLMDLDMPQCDGETAMKRIKAWNPEQVVVALTAHTMTGVRERLLRAGFDDYAPKPIRRSTLAGICRRWIVDRSDDDRSVA